MPSRNPTTRLTALSALGRRIAEPPISWLMKKSLDHPELISLAAGFTDNPSLPLPETKAALKELLNSAKDALPSLQYGPGAGAQELRSLTAARLAKLDGISDSGPLAGNYATERVMMTHGSQQLLYMLTEALFDEGDIVLVEDPTYFVFLGIAQSRAVQCAGVKMTPNGINLDDLERVLNHLKRSGKLSKLKLLYLVTYHQNPTGITTSLERKQRAVELVRSFERHAGHPIYILEDAAYRELRFAGDDVPSMLTLKGSAQRVIYAGTYSKPYATGIRVGFGALPEPLFTTVMRIKGNHDFGTAHFLQHILIRALREGRYEKHLKVLRKRYATKAAVMKAAIKKHFPADVQWAEPDGGLYFWARVPGRTKTGMNSRTFKQALANGVLYVPGELCYADDPTRPKPDCEMRISFGGASDTLIPEGIRRLGKVLGR